MWKATGADMPAAALRGTQPDVYVYRFDWDEEPTLLGADLGEMLGAAHGFEIPFVFGHFDLGQRGQRDLHRGQPSRPRPRWPKQHDGVLGAVRAHVVRRAAAVMALMPEWTAWDSGRRRRTSS